MTTEQKNQIAEDLAHFLADDLANKSMLLEMARRQNIGSGTPTAFIEDWAKLRNSFQIRGWLSYEDTLRRVKDALGFL